MAQSFKKQNQTKGNETYIINKCNVHDISDFVILPCFYIFTLKPVSLRCVSLYIFMYLLLLLLWWYDVSSLLEETKAQTKPPLLCGASLIQSCLGNFRE